ncbi:hydrogenase nickel incorporation protein HypA [Candidatus Bathyarchaeota archaeon]|nr:hydrogenase nickel incorporation protein HypA [Candidatus Bathyarchaeota archaeon]
MHEWALAEAVISTISRLAESEGLREIKEVKLKIGELQQIELEVFKFALTQLRDSSLLKNAKFNIEVVNAEIKCRNCGFKWSLEKEKIDRDAAEAIHFIPEVIHAFIRCPKCGSPDFEITGGRGVWIEDLKGVR